MTRASADAPATHFRLEPETWALAIEDYKNGASAKEVGAKWMVAPSSVYRQAAAVGAGKRDVGDARARAHARMVEEEEASARALHPVGSRALKGLFMPERESEAEAGDPAALARAATLASGRAMKGRLWAEAKALAGLAESYARLGEKQGGAGGGGSIETMDLERLFEIMDDADGRVSNRFAVDPDNREGQPHAELRRRFWERQGRNYRAMRDREIVLLNRVKDSEARLAAHGVAPQHWTEREIAAARGSWALAGLRDAEIERLEAGWMEDVVAHAQEREGGEEP